MSVYMLTDSRQYPFLPLHHTATKYNYLRIISMDQRDRQRCPYADAVFEHPARHGVPGIHGRKQCLEIDGAQRLG
jgi:hypothetical protein